MRSLQYESFRNKWKQRNLHIHQYIAKKYYGVWKYAVEKKNSAKWNTLLGSLSRIHFFKKSLRNFETAKYNSKMDHHENYTQSPALDCLKKKLFMKVLSDPEKSRFCRVKDDPFIHLVTKSFVLSSLRKGLSCYN